MKKTLLALSFLVLVLLAALVVGASLGVAQSQPVKDARPTPTPDRPIQPVPPQEGPSSPEIPLLPDLVVESIEVMPTSPLIGEKVTIRVTIANTGTKDVNPGNNFWSDLYVDPSVVPVQLGQDGVAKWPCQSWWVPKGGSHSLETTYVFTDVKNYALYAQVDTDGTVAESNENNNVSGPIEVQVRSPNKVAHQTHEDFQMGVASNLDTSHPEGVLRRGIFLEPYTDTETAVSDPNIPDVYQPDKQVDDPPLTPPPCPTCVNQVKPALASNGSGTLFAAWEDGRNGGVYNRDIYFSYSTDDGATWVHPDVLISYTDTQPITPATGIQASPDLVYEASCHRLYAVWQDKRNGNYDIYFSYSDVNNITGVPGPWSENKQLNDDVGTANQMNPSLAVGPDHKVYVVWLDQRNGNDDVYLVRSDDCGSSWPNANYFVTDDPQMTWQNQVNPSVSVGNYFGCVIVVWEDWRNPAHPEVYTMWSWDGGETFGIDVPVTMPPGLSYRVQPTVAAHTTIEVVEFWDPVLEMTRTKETAITAIHVAWQEGEGDDADVYYTYAAYVHDPEAREPCPVEWWPRDYCFEPPQKVSGFVMDSTYVRPPDETSVWPIEPSWQGQVTMDLVPDAMYWTSCTVEATQTYSKGVIIAWSDARSYDDWRYEIRIRRVGSPEGDPRVYEVCEDWAEGVVNDNAKLIPYRGDQGQLLSDQYEAFKPAATGQSNPYIRVDVSGIYLLWDDDRWDDPLKPSTVRNRDIFFARTGMEREGVYISPVIDSRTTNPKWYVLSWWGATQHGGDLLLQTRFGNTPYPPLSDAPVGTWTRWTGNPSSTYLHCTAGEKCYYDAPGRHIVDPDGKEWFDCPGPGCPAPYRYMQYKVIIVGYDRITALSQVTIYYKGPYTVYLPVVRKKY